MEELVHDVPHSYDEGQYTIDDHVELNGEVQQEIGIGDHDEDLNKEESFSDPINVIVYVGVGVKVRVATSTELKLDLNKGVIEPVHFLAIIREMSTEEVDEFVLFSFEGEGKAQATRALRNIGVRMHEVLFCLLGAHRIPMSV
ncbi:hypothetical protein J1N35_010787 [Gossypium stocksii]|uniref:Uncharacterized protein n=1 Tax=Gossypium stocksii TaxID=47602 RepID=A0A9D3W130_9ROSI|nr:hypothetical protein J1N35_010787 [Gossypium stocksii]